jgi:hypothetical protein
MEAAHFRFWPPGPRREPCHPAPTGHSGIAGTFIIRLAARPVEKNCLAAAHADVTLRGILVGFAESAAMDENRADTPEQVIEFAPKGGPRSYAPLVDEAGEVIIAKLQKAADLSNENCDRAMKLAHKLSMQIRAAEDRINQLEAESNSSGTARSAPNVGCKQFRKRSRKSSSLRDQPTPPNKPRLTRTPSYDKC